MGRTLHNVKASLMLCFWLYEPRKFIKLIRNNVGSECLRVWHNYIPGCVARVYYILMHTFPRDKFDILAWVLLCFVYHHRSPTPQLTDKRKWIPTFLLCGHQTLQQNALLGIYRLYNNV